MDHLSSFIKKDNKARSGKLSSFGSGPAADWKIILVSSFIVAFLLTALNVFIFIMIDKGEIFTVNPITPEGTNTFNLEELKATVRYYQDKAAQFESLKKATSTSFADPSI